MEEEGGGFPLHRPHSFSIPLPFSQEHVSGGRGRLYGRGSSKFPIPPSSLLRPPPIPIPPTPRSMFDLFVVVMSLIALGPISMPISVVRLMRAFR